MSPLPLLLLLGLYGMTPHAFETTVCNCTEPTKIGIIQFSDANCHPEEKDDYTVNVAYSIYSVKRLAEKFPGYICARWMQIRTTTKNFFGQIVVVPDKVPIDTSPSECNEMVNNKQCNGIRMTETENKFEYEREPETVGYWMKSVETISINCVLEKIQLYQESDGNNFSTPLGTAVPNSGNLAHNHLTLIWDKAYTQISPPTARLVESGIGNLIKKIGQEKNFRLHDSEKQLEFHILFHPRCSNLKIDCQEKEDSFNIIGQPHLFLKTAAITDTLSKEKPSRPAPPNNENNNFTAAASLQYMFDVFADHENDLARITQRLQCDTQRAAHERALSTAQYNGWLAAFQLNLPECTKIQAFGRTAVVTSCKPRNVTFETIVTACGPQPKFENYTINLDGWELVNYSPCYWTHGFVNFNDKPYAYRNNSWQPIEANIVLPEQSLAHSFRYEDIKFLNYKHQSNPAYTDTILDHMNIMADIAASINGHHSIGISTNNIINSRPNTANVLLTATGIGSYTTWWETIQTYFYIGVISLLGLLFLRICYSCGFFGLFWKICCRRTKALNRPSNEPSVHYQA